jgi:hypothetical protein
MAYDLSSSYTDMSSAMSSTMPVPVNPFIARCGMPPLDFFTAPPAFHTHIFSTDAATLTPREAVFGPIVAHTSNDESIERKIAFLREKFPDVCNGISMPRGWDDLYMYWDAFDIQCYGGGFLGEVLDIMAQQNTDRKAHAITSMTKAFLELPRVHEATFRTELGGMQRLLNIYEYRERLDWEHRFLWERELILHILNEHRNSLEPEIQAERKRVRDQNSELHRIQELRARQAYHKKKVAAQRLHVLEIERQLDAGRKVLQQMEAEEKEINVMTNPTTENLVMPATEEANTKLQLSDNKRPARAPAQRILHMSEMRHRMNLEKDEIERGKSTC